MHVQVAGCGDAFGSGGRNNACFLVEGAGTRLLLDCGPTSLPALKRLEVQPSSLDAVLVTHLHGDHFGGIPFLFLEHRYLEKRRSPLLVAGPPGLEKRVRDLGASYYPLKAASPEGVPVHFLDLEPGVSEAVGAAVVRPFQVRHAGDQLCLGLRVEVDGRTVVYSGDTEWFDGLVEASRDADLFILECTYLDEEGGRHVRLQEILENRERLRCKRLLLVHLGPRVLAERHLHDLPWAEDGQRIEL